MAGWLEEKVALITGGASGIGKAVVERFLREGARVAVFDRDDGKLASLFSRAEADRGITFHGDVTRFEDNVGAVCAAVSAFGRLDIFIGNAGVFDGFTSFERLPVEKLADAFDEVFRVNVLGYLLGAKAAFPELLKSGGNIVFTVSNAGFYPDGGGPLYTASKHAVVGLIRQLAFELAPKVRVNGVAPGGTMTDLGAVPSLKPFVKLGMDAVARAERVRGRNPLRTVMQPEDHAGAYLLLASDQGRGMTGEVIHIDGGLGVRGLDLPKKPES
jgi:NAD(P)-dependent dehydrogenase (short-subunit alcohol dehydrogenase family)